MNNHRRVVLKKKMKGKVTAKPSKMNKSSEQATSKKSLPSASHKVSSDTYTFPRRCQCSTWQCLMLSSLLQYVYGFAFWTS